MFNLRLFYFCVFLDQGHFAERVKKAATPDMWDLGVLIHNFLIKDMIRDEI